MKRGAGLFAAILVLSCGSGDAPVSKPGSSERSRGDATVITPSGEEIEVEVAANDRARARGLMFREHLPAGRGMLFLFPSDGPHNFWMKNTLIELDMIWMDLGGTIVHIESGVPPCQAEPCPSYGPERAEARYVLEVSGGEAARLGLEQGQMLKLQGIDRFNVE